MSNQNQVSIIIKGDQTHKLDLKFLVNKDKMTFTNISKMIQDRQPEYEFTVKKSNVLLSGGTREVVKYHQNSDIWLNSDNEDIKNLDISQLEITIIAIPKPKETPTSKFECYLQEAIILSNEVCCLHQNGSTIVESLQHQYKFSSVSVGKHTKQQFVLAKSGKSNIIYLAIHGLNGFDNIQDGFNFGHSDDYLSDYRVHPKLHERAKSIAIVSLFKHFYSMFKNKGQKFSFIICGYLFGGSVAQILTAKLLNYLNRTNAIDEDFVDIYSITFGAPCWVNQAHLEKIQIGPSRRLLKDYFVNIFVENDVIVHLFNFELISRLRTIESNANVAAKIISNFAEAFKSFETEELALNAAKDATYYTPVGKYYSFVDDQLKEFSPMDLSRSIEKISTSHLVDYNATHAIDKYVNKIHNMKFSPSTRGMDLNKTITSIKSTTISIASKATATFTNNNSSDQAIASPPKEQLEIDVDVCFNNECLVEVSDDVNKGYKENKKKIIKVMFDSNTPSIIGVQMKCTAIKEMENWVTLTPCGYYHDYPIDKHNKFRVTFEVTLDDFIADFANCECQVRIISPFRLVEKTLKIHIASISDKNKFSMTQIQTAYFILMTCNNEEYDSPDMKVLKEYLEKLDDLSSKSPRLKNQMNDRFKKSFERRNEICKDANVFMKQANDIKSYSKMISDAFVVPDLEMKTKSQETQKQLKTAAIIVGTLLLVAAACTGIGAGIVAATAGTVGAVSAAGVGATVAVEVATATAAAEAIAVTTVVVEAASVTAAGTAGLATLSTSLGMSSGVLGAAGILALAGGYAIKSYDKALGEAHYEKLLFLVETYTNYRPMINDVAALEEVLCKAIFGDYKDNEIPALNHVLSRVDEFKFQAEFCNSSLIELQLVTKFFVIVKYIRAILRKFKIITVLGKKNSGKTTFLKILFEHFGLDKIANSLKIAADSKGATRFCSSYIIKLKNGKKLCVIDTPGIGDVSQMTSTAVDGKRASIFSNLVLNHDCLVIVTFGNSDERDTNFAIDVLAEQEAKEYRIFGNQIDNCLNEIEESYPEKRNLKEMLDAHKTSIVEKYNKQLKKDYEFKRTSTQIRIENFHFTSFLPRTVNQTGLNQDAANSQQSLYMDANGAIKDCLMSIGEFDELEQNSSKHSS